MNRNELLTVEECREIMQGAYTCVKVLLFICLGLLVGYQLLSDSGLILG
jgi:hypothetical protein